MYSQSLKRKLFCAGAACLMLFAGKTGSSLLAQESRSAPERRGRQIYLQGTSQSGKPILAYLGDGSLEVPASTLPCASCHGATGQGKPEGGVSPSNITWETLTKPYGQTHASGRKHPVYTNRGIELAITRGLDPGGNKLLPVMPRYSMSREDMADLILYLGRLGKDNDPGLHEAEIVIGTLVPARGNLAEMGKVIRMVTAGVFADINAAGGIYNRRLELSVAETGDTPAATRANLESSLKAEPVFAMVSNFIAGSEKETLAFSNQKEIPLVGPFTLYASGEPTAGSRVFYLLSGISEQARALVEFAIKTPEMKDGGVAIVHSQNELNTAVVEAIQQQSKVARWSGGESFVYAAGSFDAAAMVRQVRQAKRNGVFLMGNSADAVSFMQEADKAAWHPYIFISGPQVTAEIFKLPAGFDRRVFISFPTAPADQSAEGLREFRAFSVKHGLPNTNLASQILAYSAARIVVESLKRAGRDLTREGFLAALESLYEHQTGLIPPISFGPNRRTGSLGAYIVTINLKEKKFEPASGFIDLGRTK